MAKRFDRLCRMSFSEICNVREAINQCYILNCCGMKTLFDMIFGVVKFTFKVTFWIIGVVIALLIGSCPD